MKLFSQINARASACAFLLLILVLLGCGGLIQPLSQTPTFVAVNYYDDSTAHLDIVVDTSPEATLATNLGFGEVATAVTTDAPSNVSVSSRLTGTTVNLQSSGVHTISNYNAVVAFGTPSEPEVRAYPLVQQEAPFIKIIHANHIQTSGYDVYITSPGADLTTLSPDFENLDYTRGADLGNAAHVGANFQVRLCTAGTKNVTAIFTPISSAEANTSYVFIAGLGGATTDVAQFSVATTVVP